jgi:hypothetical protein
LHGLVLVYVVVVVSALVLLFLLRLTRPLPKKDLRLKLRPTEVRLELIPLELSRQTKIIDLLLQPFEVPLQRLVKNCPFFRMRADFEQTFESRIHVLELGVLALLARLRLATRALQIEALRDLLDLGESLVGEFLLIRSVKKCVPAM